MTDHPKAPPAPANAEILAPVNPSEDTLTLLARRRSTPIAMLGAPGPDSETVLEIIRLAARVPDHRRLGPWRFIIIDSETQGDALGRSLEKIRSEELGADYTEGEKTTTLNLFKRAPVSICVVSSPDHAHKTPVWEQELSAGAACQNMLLAANAMGWAGAWLTEWCAFSDAAKTVFGVAPHERIAGFIYLGTAQADPPERLRPDLASRITYWSGN